MNDRYFLVVEACLRWMDNGYEFNVINEALRDYGYNSEQRDEIFASVQRELKKKGRNDNATD